jgi:hypothetical protein
METTMTGTDFARTVQKQIGMMTLGACGAREFIYKWSDGEQYLQFTVARKTARRISKVRVTLTPMDVYDVALYVYDRKTLDTTTVESVEGIYADQLSETVYGMVNK